MARVQHVLKYSRKRERIVLGRAAGEIRAENNATDKLRASSLRKTLTTLTMHSFREGGAHIRMEQKAAGSPAIRTPELHTTDMAPGRGFGKEFQVETNQKAYGQQSQ